MADLVSSILKPGSVAYNINETAIPVTTVWFHGMDQFYLGFICFSTLCTCIVVAVSILHLYYVLKYISSERIQTDMYYLVFMYPVTSLCGTIGMYIPRAAPFLYSVALVYYMLCLFVVISLLFNIFGNRRQMSEYLRQRQVPISFKVTPLCCVPGLPKIEPTERNLRRCEWMVFQTPLVRCVLEVANVAVFLELNSRKHLLLSKHEFRWFTIANTVGLISMCIAFYGCYVLVPLGSGRLQAFRFTVLFRIVDVAQCLYTIQKFCLDLAANLDFIEGDDLMPATAKAQFWTSFMLTWEMLLLSILSTYLLGPHKSALFDKYPRNGQPNRATSNSSDTVTESIEAAEAADKAEFDTPKSTLDRKVAPPKSGEFSTI